MEAIASEITLAHKQRISAAELTHSNEIKWLGEQANEAVDGIKSKFDA